MLVCKILGSSDSFTLALRSRVVIHDPTRHLDEVVLTGALKNIIKNQDCAISGDNLRSGHRAERHDGKGKLSSRLRKNQRKDSQNERPLHPDAQDAYNALVHFEDIDRDLDPEF